MRGGEEKLSAPPHPQGEEERWREVAAGATKCLGCLYTALLPPLTQRQIEQMFRGKPKWKKIFPRKGERVRNHGGKRSRERERESRGNGQRGRNTDKEGREEDREERREARKDGMRERG